MASRSRITPRIVALLAMVIATIASLGEALADPVKQGTDAGIEAIITKLGHRWAFFVLGGCIVFVAWLVNRYAPHRRKRIRRVVILFLIYLLCFGLSEGMRVAGLAATAENIHILATLCAWWTAIDVAGLLIVDLALPAVRMQPATILSDVMIGVAYIVATVWVLRAAGVSSANAVTGGAVVSGIVALSLQNTLSNIFGGVALQIDDSIHAGDWIQLENGKQGKVKQIRWRHTVVETRDWDTIIVPNSSLLGGNITILGKREGMPLQHRMWVYFNVDFRYSPSRVISAVNEALQAAPIERIAAEPKPHCIAYDFARDGRDSFGYYAVRYWLTDIAVDDPTSSVVRARIYHALRRVGIPLARPTTTTFLHLEDEDSEQKRLARHREQRIAALRTNVLFKPLTDEELIVLADRLRYAPFTAGETITKQGAVAHWLYILAAGTADIRATVEGVTKTIAKLNAPAFFGEMGMMTGEPRSADVVATAEVECFRLDKAGFQNIIEERPEIASEMSKTLAERRVELMSMREGLDAEAKRAREAAERQAILGKIQDFFGLRSSSISPPRR